MQEYFITCATIIIPIQKKHIIFQVYLIMPIYSIAVNKCIVIFRPLQVYITGTFLQFRKIRPLIVENIRYLASWVCWSINLHLDLMKEIEKYTLLARIDRGRFISFFPFCLWSIWEFGRFKKSFYLINLLSGRSASRLKKKNTYFCGTLI